VKNRQDGDRHTSTIDWATKQGSSASKGFHQAAGSNKLSISLFA
jgi:hypothetical protein